MEKWIIYHSLAFFGGFVLDGILGDPHSLPHPVRLIGGLILWLERRLRGKEGSRADVLKGLLLVISVCLLSILLAGGITALAYLVHPYAGIAVELLLTYYAIALKSLRLESMKVVSALEEEGLSKAKKALSMVVGRDTEPLDEAGVLRAAVETVAENASDGIIAPLFYLAIGGPALGWFYKAVNTMDSMVGYKNEKYLYFGRCAARLDDFVNYIPSRISGILISISAFFSGREFSGKCAFKIWRRDGRNHKSPNSAQGEAAAAGALGIRLGGGAYYFGEWVEKPTIGDDRRPIERSDVGKCNNLIRNAFILWWLILLSTMIIAAVILHFT